MPPSAASVFAALAVRVSCQVIAGATVRPVARSQRTTVSRWFVIPMAARSAGDAPADFSASWMHSWVSCQTSSMSSSTQPGRGKCIVCSRCAVAAGTPRASKRMQRVLLVPWSTAKTNLAATSVVLLGRLERIRSRPARRLRFQPELRLLEIVQRLVAGKWVLRVELDQRVGDHGSRSETREPLAVGGDHVPRRPLGAGVAEHLRERVLVGIPEVPLLHVVRGELPVVIGQVDAPQEADTLLFLREVQEQLHDPEAVLREVPLPVVDRLVPPCPDVMPARLGGKVLAHEVLRMHPDDQHLLVVRTVEDSDLSARRQPLLV